MERTRTGVRLTKPSMRLCEKHEFRLSREEANLSAVEFERLIIRKVSDLHAIPRPIPYQLQSFYSRGTDRPVEPIIDAYYEKEGKRMLVEIKKGFTYVGGRPVIATSREQVEVLSKGTTRHGGGGNVYNKGEFWVFERMRNQNRNTKTVKFTWWRVPKEVVGFMNINFDRYKITLAEAVRL